MTKSLNINCLKKYFRKKFSNLFNLYRYSLKYKLLLRQVTTRNSMEIHPIVDASTIEKELFDRYGPLMTDDVLRIALGYKSTEAFRQALTRKTVPVPVFSILNRRGKYALVKDVAIWLANQRNSILDSQDNI